MRPALPDPVTPAVLAWARLESGYPVERVADRLNVKHERVAEWEQGARPPTLRQIEKLAHFYHRPLSLFFQPAPPQVPPLAAEYRRLPDVVPGREAVPNPQSPKGSADCNFRSRILRTNPRHT